MERKDFKMRIKTEIKKVWEKGDHATFKVLKKRLKTHSWAIGKMVRNLGLEVEPCCEGMRVKYNDDNRNIIEVKNNRKYRVECTIGLNCTDEREIRDKVKMVGGEIIKVNKQLPKYVLINTANNFKPAMHCKKIKYFKSPETAMNWVKGDNRYKVVEV
jgi:hypothetical protein